MTVHWTTRLYCSECNTAITYVDERPDWQVDEERERALTIAATFAEKYPTYRSIPVGARKRGNFSPLISHNDALLYVTGDAPTDVDPIETHYIPCPACDARVYRDQHAEDADAEDETQAVS